jgi:hypothetical protein
MITAETITAGIDKELSRIVSGPRAMIFLATSGGRFGIASVEILSDGSIGRRLSEFDTAVVEARRAFAFALAERPQYQHTH